MNTQLLKGMPARESEMMLNMHRALPFMLMCEAVGSEALPSQIERLEAKAKEMFVPKYYDYPIRAAAEYGITLNLGE
ncbi:MAG: hypothetical protein RR740_00670 [Pseudomonas sp.]